MKRKAIAVWKGSGKEGSGHLTTDSKALNQTAYNYVSRFESGSETNPEELIAAAHAGCFTMKLSFLCGAAGHVPEELHSTCEITLESGTITSSHITLKAKISGMDAAKFAEVVADAEKNCPVSKVLNAKISVDFTLN